jgi:hypothetical protein
LISLISPRFESSFKVFTLRRKSQAVDFSQFYLQPAICGIPIGHSDDDHACAAIFIFERRSKCSSAFKQKLRRWSVV